MRYLKHLLVVVPLCLLMTLGAEEFDLLSNEQKAKAYLIILELENNAYDSKVLLSFVDGHSESHDIQSLKSKLFSSLEPSSLGNDDMHDILISSFSDAKIQKINDPKINFFSKINGKRIASFECRSLKIGKMRLGPFEIPSNKILIELPRIRFY
ncbi:MAG: hypothetical protein P8I61_00325 [Opitutae bacterium]|nr:hypothetical protein [Opitutae bacterium]